MLLMLPLLDTPLIHKYILVLLVLLIKLLTFFVYENVFIWYGFIKSRHRDSPIKYTFKNSSSVLIGIVDFHFIESFQKLKSHALLNFTQA